MVQENPPEPLIIDPDDELGQVQKGASNMVARALILWAVRWTIGFGLIWAITSWTGRFDWLWVAGLIVAGLSLATTLYWQVALARQASRTKAKLQELEELVAEMDEDDRP